MTIERNGPKIDYSKCTGCGTCYDICQGDIYTWDDEKGLPVIARPDECFLCAFCDLECPEEAISFAFPLHAMIDMGIFPKIGS